MSPESVVIVGAGQAGYQVAASLRQEKYTGSITIVGNEAELPYQRPPLSKAYMTGKIGVANLRFRQQDFYAEQGIDLRRGSVAAIDRSNRRITLDSGEAIAYGHLVLATGAHNRTLPVPGADLAGVYGIRTLADADAISARLQSAKSVVVVGAGFIGLEFAAVASSLGIAVHVLELGERLMARAVSPAMSEVFRAAHASWGVQFDFRQGLVRILGTSGQVSGVETGDGRVLPADLVVFGIGVIPNTRLAEEAGLDIDNGIKVDADLLTRDPAISAIGDAAAFPSAHLERHIRIESVQNAMDQARLVAARLVGKGAAYDALPWFWSDQRELKLQIAGLHEGHDATVVLAGDTASQLTVLCFRGERLLAVETLNRAADHMAARKLLGRRAPLTPRLAGAAGFDLKAFEAATR